MNVLSRAWFWLMVVAVLAGCAGKAVKPQERAESFVDQVLDAWARGEPAQRFADPERPLQASDPDWQAGCRLLSFMNVEVKPHDTKPEDVRCRVALSLQDRQGKRIEKEVVYAVRLGDKVVVSRE